MKKSMRLNNNVNNISKIRQYSRITLEIKEFKELQQLNDNNKILASYDLVAIKCSDEKIFHSLLFDYDVFFIILS